jgi:hypothetical protein
MRIQLRLFIVAWLGIALGLTLASGVPADEAPIAGVVKSIDMAAGTFVVERTTRGRVRQVVVHMRPESKVIRLVRSSDPGKSDLREQPSTLGELKAGWTVSVTARHEGSREVAVVVRVIQEK